MRRMMMRSLRKLLLINWYSYSKEVISFERINFLTGKTASGKSTVIDALQLVLLGNTNGSFFNKAANEKSDRSLKGYLFGEKGDDGDTGFSYLRNDNFTAYVVCEFLDEIKKKPFLLGIVCDCRSDQTYTYKWLKVMNHGLPDHLFVAKDDVPVSLGDLSAYLKGWAGHENYELIDSNKRYRDSMLALFGHVKPKYLTLLKKAVPFTPISDIEKFITESICDVSSVVDIEHMQNDIRQYKSLEKDMLNLERKIGRLREISDSGRKYAEEYEKYRQQDYIVMRSQREQADRKLDAVQEEIAARRRMLQEYTEKAESLKQAVAALQERLKEREREYYSSDIVKKKEQLEAVMKELSGKADELEKNVTAAVNGIHVHGRKWTENCKVFVGLQLFPAENLETWRKTAARMETLTRTDAEKYHAAAFAEVSSVFREAVSDKGYELSKESEILEAKLSDVRSKIADLKKGIKPYPVYVQMLKKHLDQSLPQVSILADLLEIRDPRWRNAIEGYLDRQKFYLLVPGIDYREALHIYDRVKKTEEVSGAGLIDIEKLRAGESPSARPGSLAEQVISENADAKAYIDYLLGNVMCCDTVDELRGYRTAITDECMLYKGYVARQIERKRYDRPYIGRNSLKLLLKSSEEELQQLTGNQVLLEEKRSAVQAAKSGIFLDEYEAKDYERFFEQGKQEPQIRTEMEKVTAEYNALDFTYSDKIKQQIEELKIEISQKDDAERKMESSCAVMNEHIENLTGEKLPEAEQNSIRLEAGILEKFEESWIIATAEPRFLQEFERRNRNPEALITGFQSARAQTDKHLSDLRNDRTRLRSDYNRDFIMSYDISAETNDAYEKDLKEYESIELPKYKTDIEESQQRAYRQFRDDFLAKIKSNIQTVQQQIAELNSSLKKSVFGTDSYRFTVSPRAEYHNLYNMFMDQMLMETGGDYNLFSNEFETKYKTEIETLFRQLIVDETNLTAEKRDEYEKAIQKWTDYKTYLVFDLIVTNDRGEEQKLSRTLKKKSGGETQIPFYISLLASFSQVCRIRNTNQNNTIRIIMLDEAFSKMDGERIKESIRLLRKFELQAIFSAPPEKIPDIAPLVDRNIAVYKNGDDSFTRAFDAKEIDDELMSEA